MRRLSERARLEGMLALRKALEGVRRVPATPPAHAHALAASTRGDHERTRDQSPPDRSRWLTRDHTAPADASALAERAAPAAPAAPARELAVALDRIADAIEGIAVRLDSYHLDRAEHLDAIEFLLRELVIGSVPPAAAPAAVLGGVVDRRDPDPDDDIVIIPDADPLEPGTAVEVRSRFHERWIPGFNIAEAVEIPGRCRYRLTRRSDGIPLPILFEACDVRAAPAATHRDTPARSFRGESRLT